MEFKTAKQPTLEVLLSGMEKMIKMDPDDITSQNSLFLSYTILSQCKIPLEQQSMVDKRLASIKETPLGKALVEAINELGEEEIPQEAIVQPLEAVIRAFETNAMGYVLHPPKDKFEIRMRKDGFILPLAILIASEIPSKKKNDVVVRLTEFMDTPVWKLKPVKTGIMNFTANIENDFY